MTAKLSRQQQKKALPKKASGSNPFAIELINLLHEHHSFILSLLVPGTFLLIFFLAFGPKTILSSIIACLLTALLAFLAGVEFVSRFFSRALRNLTSTAKVTDYTQQLFRSDHVPSSLQLVQETGVDLLDAFFRASNESLIKVRNGLVAQLEEAGKIAERYKVLTTNLAASVQIRSISGKTIFCSPYTEVLTGYSSDDIISDKTKLEEIVLSEDKERYQRALKVAELGEDILVRYRILHRSGIRLWLETHLVPIRDEKGTVCSLMSVTIDVTDTLTYQKEVEDRNQDLSEFAYMVSHDLKAPLFTIQGMANAMLEDHGADLRDDAKGLLLYIVDAAHRLERLVSSIIEYSALSTAAVTDAEINLNETIDSVLRDQGEFIRQRRAFIDIDPMLPTVRGNELRLYQIFSNLFGNALKFTPSDRSPEISVKARWENQDSVTIDIEDNACGIPEDKLKLIFRPFARIHTDIEGSGIGLACVRKIVERMGGSITVDSRLGVGSIFHLVLPLSVPKPRQVPPNLERIYQH